MPHHPRRHPLVFTALLLLTVPAPRIFAADPPPTADSVYDAAFHFLATGHQHDAERVLTEAVTVYDTDARLAFFRAACTRSRFDTRAAFFQFKRVVDLDPSGPYGHAAARILILDASQESSAPHFAALAELANKHPDSPLLTWMAAVQCRSLNRPTDGIAYFDRLAKTFDAAGGPGPSLFHQTYANLLDKVGRYGDALPHRLLAVQLEPAAWSYDGLGNTLTGLRRWADADDAYAHAVALDPKNAQRWSNWSSSLRVRGDWQGVVDKCAKGVALDPMNVDLWHDWGDAEAHLNHPANALRCYDNAIRARPNDFYAYRAAADVLEHTGRSDQAQVYRALADRLRPHKPTTAPSPAATAAAQ